MLRETDPPHLIFMEGLLPDGTWADVVKLALGVLKPVKVIVVSRLIDVKLYVETMTRGAFDFIVPPLTRDELAHVVACAVESVLNLRRTQAPWWPGHSRAAIAGGTRPPSVAGRATISKLDGWQGE